LVKRIPDDPAWLVGFLKEASGKSYAPAEAELGLAEVTGQFSGIAVNVVDGKFLIDSAMRQGSPDAELAEGLYLRELAAGGNPLTNQSFMKLGPDASAACDHLRKAASGGRNQAWYYLAEVEACLGKCADALRDMQIGANAGYWAARTALGTWYEFGIFRPSDINRAQQWYLAATEDPRDIKDSALELAQFYERNNDLPRADENAFEWYSKAAEAGDLGSKHKVAMDKLVGMGTKVDIAGGLSLLQTAAAGGNAEALLELGILQMEGVLVPRDVAAARRSFEVSAKAGNTEARTYLQWLDSSAQGKSIK